MADLLLSKPRHIIAGAMCYSRSVSASNISERSLSPSPALMALHED